MSLNGKIEVVESPSKCMHHVVYRPEGSTTVTVLAVRKTARAAAKEANRLLNIAGYSTMFQGARDKGVVCQ